MHLGYSLLVTTIILLATCDVVSSATAVSEAKSTNLLRPSDRIRNDSKRRRFLRSHESTTDNVNENNQERTINFKKSFGFEKKGPNLFSKKIVKKMQNDWEFKLEMFAKWKQAKLSVGKMGKKLNTPKYEENDKLLVEYVNHVNPKVPQVLRNRRVHFGADHVHYFSANEKIDELPKVGRLKRLLTKLREVLLKRLSPSEAKSQKF